MHRGGFCPEVFKDPLFYFLVLGFDKLPLWGILLISAGSAVVCALIVWFFVCPRMKKKIERKYRTASLRSPLGKGPLALTNFRCWQEILLAAGLFLVGICSLDCHLSCWANPEAPGHGLALPHPAAAPGSCCLGPPNASGGGAATMLPGAVWQ